MYIYNRLYCRMTLIYKGRMHNFLLLQTLLPIFFCKRRRSKSFIFLFFLIFFLFFLLFTLLLLHLHFSSFFFKNFQSSSFEAIIQGFLYKLQDLQKHFWISFNIKLVNFWIMPKIDIWLNLRVLMLWFLINGPLRCLGLRLELFWMKF